VFVASHLTCNELRPLIDHPPQRVPEEKAPVGCQPRDHLMISIPGRLLEGLVGRDDAAKVGSVPSWRQLSIDVQAVDRDAVVRLLHDQSRPCVQLRAVLGRPPIAEVPFSMIFAPLIVEAMSDLTSERPSDDPV
jgi:hypothetical protein